jgi:hypothetical protein
MIGAITAGLLSEPIAPVTSSYESIATVSLGSSQTTISFSSIPSTYKHLQLRFIARSTRVNAGDYMNMRFNSDSSSIYAKHHLAGDGSGAGAGAQSSAAQIELNRISAANATSGVFGAGVIDLLDYANTSKNKTARALIAYDNNGSGEIYFQSGLWASTTAVNAISFTCNNDFAANSQFALYGIKG